MTLTRYRQKRNFKETPEPGAKKESSGASLEFVVQRHKATRLHYDFRLEMEGVLKSWAVPKGPSLNPADKRLAMMVEDHPYEYRKFKGVIPEGNYGAGIVEIWDKGTYTHPEAKNRAEAEKKLLHDLKKGNLKFILKGKKLKGEFALVKMNGREENSWLLIKHNDRYAVEEEYNSEDHTPAVSPINKALREKEKNKKSRAGTGKKKVLTRSPSISNIRVKETEKYRDFIKPMLATIGGEAFDDPDWIFEVKWDGYRAIAELGNGRLKLYSRNGLSFMERYEPVAEALQKIKGKKMIIDGEIVVLDEAGRPDFQKLQQYTENPDYPIYYYIFDILSYDGNDLRSKPLRERKKILSRLIKGNGIVRYSDHVEEKGKALFKTAVKSGLEGIMAKRGSSIYREGQRSPEWLKIRNHNTEEVIICGYTPPQRSRKYFGSLVLGTHDENGKLRYAGRAGTGFNDRSLKELYEKMQRLVIPAQPFDIRVKSIGAPATWVKPELVCNVKYTEWTTDGRMRHPVFMGLRIDKEAEEVKMPKPKAVKKSKTITGDSLTIAGKKVAISHPEKVFWPDEGITKGDVIEYYRQVHKWILPYLKNRPQSLKRNPNGIKDEGFFQKDAGDQAPEWVDTIELYSDSAKKDINYIICNDQASLLYLANLGCIELNPWNSRVDSLDNPDYLVMDIDPSEKNSFDQVIDTALVIKEILDKAGAKSFCKTSGSSGLHVYVPLNARYTYEQARRFAEIIAVMTTEQLPDFTTVERSLKQRGRDMIYVDYLQNKRGQTLASAYCLRPRPGATVSTPLKWEEVKSGLHPSMFDINTLPARLEKTGDLFKGVLGKGIDLDRCLKNLSA